MTKEQSFIISLLRKSMGNDERIESYERIDESEVERIIIRNGILLSVYPVIKNLEYAEKLKSRLETSYYLSISRAANQKHDGFQVLNCLNEAGLDCIALKGWELRYYYPNPNMRQMVDVDILVRPYDYKKIKEIMEQLGYSGSSESSWKHDTFRKKMISFEMHKRLTDDSGVIQQWEKQMWKRAIPEKEHILKMKPEDFYIFHFVHLHKDFLNGSLGLRRIIDTWLLQNQSLDMALVKTVLKEMGMDLFHERMVTLSKALMDDEFMDENSEVLLTHAFNYGIYGTNQSYKAGRIVALSKGKGLARGKIKSLIAAVFLPYSRMKAQFPDLMKWPVLLPYYWAVRITRFLQGDLKKSKQMLDYNGIKAGEYQEMSLFFKAGGVL